MQTLNSIIVTAVANAKRALRAHQIHTIVAKKRPGTSADTINTTLSTITKIGGLVKIPVSGEGKAKFAYAPGFNVKMTKRTWKNISVAKLVRTVLTVDAADSLDVFQKVHALNPQITRVQVQGALQDLVFAKKNPINRSKNPMTDENTVSSQSKFLYSATQK